MSEPTPNSFSELISGAVDTFFELVFKTIETLISSVSAGTESIANSIISLGNDYNVLPILFAIQSSILVFKLVMDDDGFDVVTGFIRQIALYTIIFAVLNNWNNYGFGLINFANGWMTGAVVNASATITGGAKISGNMTDPVSAFSYIQNMYSSKFLKLKEDINNRLDNLYKELHGDSLSEKIAGKESNSIVKNIVRFFTNGDAFFAGLIDILSLILIDIANLILWAVIGFIILYMFIGWLKALFGAAFGPLAFYILPIDGGRLLSTAVSFILGGVGSYAFSLVIAMLTMNMFVAGSDLILNKIGSAKSMSEAASHNLLFSLSIMLLSIIMFMVTSYAKNWGAEFFGTMSYSLPHVRFRGNKRRPEDPNNGGGGRKKGKDSGGGGGGGNKA